METPDDPSTGRDRSDPAEDPAPGGDPGAGRTSPASEDAADELPGGDVPALDDDTVREALARLGHAGTPELVEELGDAVRRGNSVAALAGEGSGKEVLYALAAAERSDPASPAVQALVLSPTREGTIRAARALHLLGAPAGLEALAWLPWSRPDEEGGRPFAQLLAGRPAELIPQVRAGRLKLSDLVVVAIDGASALEETGQWEAAASILETLPSEAQKIVTDVERGDRLEQIVTHQMSRARKWPPELFRRGEGGPEASGPPLMAAAAADEEDRVDRLADALRHAVESEGCEQAAVLCPDGDSAHRVAGSLAARGLRLTDDPEQPGILVAWGDESPPEDAARVLYGLPPSLEVGRRWLDGGPARAAVVGAGELAQLRILARRAGWPLRSVPESAPAEARDTVRRFRERVRERLRQERDWTDLVLLEPLFGEFGAARVAGALSGLLREASPVPDGPGEPAPAPGGGDDAGGEREGPRRTPPEATRSGAGWTRLYVNAGERDEVGPGDLVGAITGETSAVGGQIGRIDVRHSYSLVDVDPEVADEVMERLTGVTIKGREVVARPDRKS